MSYNSTSYPFFRIFLFCSHILCNAISLGLSIDCRDAAYICCDTVYCIILVFYALYMDEKFLWPCKRWLSSTT